MNKKRREFLTTVAQSGMCLLCLGTTGSLIASCDNAENNITESSFPLTQGDPVIDLASETGLQNIGGAVKKRFTAINNGRTIIIVRQSASSFSAFGAQCTHQGTEISLPVSGIMTCPNHGSKFTAGDGSVTQGPAGSPLSRFTAVYDSVKNTVTIS